MSHAHNVVERSGSGPKMASPAPAVSEFLNYRSILVNVFSSAATNTASIMTPIARSQATAGGIDALVAQAFDLRVRGTFQSRAWIWFSGN